MTAILSIQSSVAYGHVGNSAATFPLMRLGVEVWPVLTVHFSNHTGYESWRGPLLAASDVADVIKGLDERGVLARCDAVLSGYQGGADVGAVILDAVALVKERNPDAIYCCDPVMGDVDRGIYVREGIPEFMRDRVVPAAQILTPNHFELEFLTGRPAKTLDDVITAADEVRAMGPDTVLVTSVVHDLVAEDRLQMIAVTEGEAWSVTLPLLNQTFTGSGDLTAAMFLAHVLTTDLPTALSRTAAIVHGVLSKTVASGQSELQLVAAQDEMAAPSQHFEATRVR